MNCLPDALVDTCPETGTLVVWSPDDEYCVILAGFDGHFSDTPTEVVYGITVPTARPFDGGPF